MELNEIKQIITKIEYLKQEISSLEDTLHEKESLSKDYDNTIDNKIASPIFETEYYQREKDGIVKVKNEMILLKDKIQKLLCALAVNLALTSFIIFTINNYKPLIVIMLIARLPIEVVALSNTFNAIKKEKILRNKDLYEIENLLEEKKALLEKYQRELEPIYAKKEILQKDISSLQSTIFKKRKEKYNLEKDKNKKYESYINSLENYIAFNIKPIDNQVSIKEYITPKRKVKKPDHFLNEE